MILQEFFDYLAALPYDQRGFLGGLMCFAITASLCKLVEIYAHSGARPSLRLCSILAAIGAFYGSIWLAVHQQPMTPGLGGLLGYSIGIMLLRHYRLEAAKPKKGPWG